MRYLFSRLIFLIAVVAILPNGGVYAAQSATIQSDAQVLMKIPLPAAVSRPMPKLGVGEFGTNVDNLRNTPVGGGVPAAGGDGDMGGRFPPCIFNNSRIHPIEYNINIPRTPGNLLRFDPLLAGGNFRTDVWDVDTNTIRGNPEIDSVFINGVKLGILSGSNNRWGVNNFIIPAGTLKWGLNTVRILVDRGNAAKGRASWCTAIGWGIIRLPKKGIIGKGCNVDIVRGWISPRDVVRGGVTNFFAEVSGNPPFVSVYYHPFAFNGVLRGRPFVNLFDPDGDGVYTNAKVIPRTFRRGWQGWFHWFTVNHNPVSKRRCISEFPAVKVLK